MHGGRPNFVVPHIGRAPRRTKAKIQNIADILVDPEGALERRTHWEKTSHSLLVGVILHVLYAEEKKTEAVCLRRKIATKAAPLNLIGKLNRWFRSRHTVAALSSSQWSLKLEVIYER